MEKLDFGEAGAVLLLVLGVPTASPGGLPARWGSSSRRLTEPRVLGAATKTESSPLPRTY